MSRVRSWAHPASHEKDIVLLRRPVRDQILPRHHPAIQSPKSGSAIDAAWDRLANKWRRPAVLSSCCRTCMQRRTRYGRHCWVVVQVCVPRDAIRPALPDTLPKALVTALVRALLEASRLKSRKMGLGRRPPGPRTFTSCTNHSCARLEAWPLSPPHVKMVE